MTNPLPASCQMGKNYKGPLKIGNKTGMLAFTSVIQHSTGSPSHSNQTRRRNKRHLNWKEKSKTVTMCSWHDTVYTEL